MSFRVRQGRRPVAPVYLLVLAASSALGQPWTPIQASSIALPSGARVSGRVNVAVPDPRDPNVMYLGMNAGRDQSLFPGLPGDSTLVGVPRLGGGGVWKTTNWLDANPTWTPLTDDQPSLSIGVHGLAIAPGRPDVLYAAADGPQGAILKTTDAGKSWRALGRQVFSKVQFGGIAVSPSSPDTLYAAVFRGDERTPGGVYRSTDGGSSWTSISRDSMGDGDVSHVVIHPSEPEVLYAGYVDEENPANQGVWKSTDGGSSWTKLGGFPQGFTVSLYIELAIAPSSPDTVYAVIFDRPATSKPVYRPKLYRTTDGGTTWALLCPTFKAPDTRYWHQVLAVHPRDPDIVYATGEDHFGVMSTTGGLSKGCSPSPWKVFWRGDDPVGVTLFERKQGQETAVAMAAFGDRGIYLCTTPTEAPCAFQHKQGNLSNPLMFEIAVDPDDPSTVYGIAFDQGHTFKTAGGSGQPPWQTLDTGQEMGTVLVDPGQPQTVYNIAPVGVTPAFRASNFLQRSEDGGRTWTNATGGFSASDFWTSRLVQVDPAAWKALAIDPTNPSRLLFGARRVFETLDQGRSWKPISQVLAPGKVSPNSSTGVAFISALAIAPSRPAIAYAANSNGKLFVAQPGKPSWRLLGGPSIPPGGFIAVIAVAPSTPDQLFLVAQGPTAAGRVWTTKDGGATWSDLTGDLPSSLAVYSLAVDWSTSGPVLYVGTDRGVYSARAAGSNVTWGRFGTGLPNTLVQDLVLLPGKGLLTAATYGRGAFQIQLIREEAHAPTR